MAARSLEHPFVRKHNRLRTAEILLSIVGLADSAYLSWIKLAHEESRCIVGLGDCLTVNTSRYSEIFGVPIALFGLAGYIIIVALLLLESRNSDWQPNTSMAVFGIALFGTLFSAYLTYIEIVVIRAVCPFCVLSAIVMLSLLIISIVRLALPASES